MKPIRAIIASVIVVLGSVPIIFSSDQPAPEGYSWQAIPEINAKFLLPTGWFFRSAPDKDFNRYLICALSIEDSSICARGVTIEVHLQIKNETARDYVVASIKRILDSGEVIQPFFEEPMGGTPKFGGIVSLPEEAEGAGRMVMALAGIGIQKTNTAYFIRLQSRESDWEATWSVGRWVIGRFVLDDDY